MPSPIVITSAGMPRSASTWLYNVIRLVLSRSEDVAKELTCGRYAEWDTLPSSKFRLVKVHEFQPELAKISTVTFYSYRDIRDAVASQQRKFGGTATAAWAKDYVDWHE